MINRNMRCIETHIDNLVCRNLFRLIETWDVLKPVDKICKHADSEINRNMRCIETNKTSYRPASLWINRNMRCIETFLILFLHLCYVLINRNMRCIETLHILRIPRTWVRLIETWDVLKRNIFEKWIVR